MNQILATFIQALFVVAVAPLTAGLVKFFKARLQGRKGASPFLPYYTLATLFKKEMVIPKAASWIFKAVPFVVLSSTLALAFILPLLFKGGALAHVSDFLVVAGILMIGSIFLVLGGLESGSAFGGMGSSRELTIAALVEPTMIMIFATFGFVGKTTAIDGMLGQSLVATHPYLALSVLAFLLIALAENARYPVDNPATHLELTMVHEAMILEYSGPYLAMLELAAAIKLTVFVLLLANLLFPFLVIGAVGFGAMNLVSTLVWGIVKIVAAMALLALLESTIVKMRFYRMQEYLSLAFFVALLGMVIAVTDFFMDFAIGYHVIFATLAIFSVIFLFGMARVRAMMRYYAFSSLAIAGIAFSLGLVEPAEKSHLWLFAAVTILIKVFAVPYAYKRVLLKYGSAINVPSFLRPATNYFLAAVILGVTFFILKHNPIVGMVEFDSLLFTSIALVSLGLATMIVHRNIFSQIIGLLVIENGLAVFTLATVKSLPVFVEMGIFLVTVSSVFILTKLSVRIKEYNESVDTEKLRNLTE